MDLRERREEEGREIEEGMERGRNGRKEREIDLLFHLSSHLLADSYMCPN